jgi:hypothetical protein
MLFLKFDLGAILRKEAGPAALRSARFIHQLAENPLKPAESSRPAPRGAPTDELSPPPS